ncbi:MAG: methyltransferase domain-containing protein, partial [Cetobacterium sp.]
QGIASIILGREGKKVLGIDLLNESIEFAKTSLQNEEESTRNNVRFETSNFMNYDFKDEKYDSILITEVLEHVTDPKSFIQKAEKYLVDQGRIVISVPFGINDYFDHKKTYYVYDLLELVKDNFEVSEIKIMGKWIGIVVKKGTFDVDYKEQLKKLEDGFYNLERELLEFDKRSKQKIDTNYKNYLLSNEKLIECNNKYKEATSSVVLLKSKLKELEIERDLKIAENSDLKNNLENVLEKSDILEAKIKELEENIIQNIQLEELEKQNLELKYENKKILTENIQLIEREKKLSKELEIERDLKIAENSDLKNSLENALEKSDILEAKIKELEENIIQNIRLEELEKQNLELKYENKKILTENIQLIEREKKLFKELEIERDLKIAENSDLKNSLENVLEKSNILEAKIKELEENIIQNIQLEELEKQNLELKCENERVLIKSLEFVEQERRVLKEIEAERKLQKDKLEKHKKELEFEKKLLQVKLEKVELDRQKFKEKLESLYIVHRNLNNKYKSLFNSKLGKVVRKYRKIRNNLKRNS